MRARSILVVPAIVGIALMAASAARRGRYTVPLSTWSTAEDGAKAFFTLLAETGRRPARWTQDLGRLPPGGLLVALGQEEPERKLGRRERARLEQWIRSGGTLLVLGAQDYVPEDVLVSVTKDVVGVGAEPKSEPETETEEPLPWAEVERLKPEGVAPAPHPMVAGLTSVSLRGPHRIKVDVPGFEVLLGDPKVPLGLLVPHGHGRIIALASASLATNSDLAVGDHAPLLLRIVDRFRGGGRVLFDEYHLGMGQGRSVTGYLRDRGLGPALVQLVLVVLLVCFRSAIRFGAPSPSAPPRPDDASTYVEGMGRIYARAKDLPASFDRVLGGALSRVAARHGLPPTAGANALADELRRAGRARPAEVVLRMAARRGSLGAQARPSDLVEFTRDIDRLSVEAEGVSR